MLEVFGFVLRSNGFSDSMDAPHALDVRYLGLAQARTWRHNGLLFGEVLGVVLELSHSDRLKAP